MHTSRCPHLKGVVRTDLASVLGLMLAASLVAQERAVPGVLIAAPAAPAQDPAKTKNYGFSPSMLRYHAGDALPDFPMLLPDGTESTCAALRGKTSIVVMLPSIAEEPRATTLLASAKALAERYASYDVKTLVGALWMTKADFLAAAKQRAGKWPFTIFGDPVGPYAGPTDDQDARMAHHSTTLLGKLFQGGMTTPLPVAFVIDGEGKLAGTFPLRTVDVSFDGVANLLLRAGVQLAAKHQPSEVAPASAFAKAPPRPREDPVTLVTIGSVAKDFAMQDVDGKQVRLADYAGKVVILDFWATWCGPCKAALPHVQEVATKCKDQDVVVIASCTNDARAAFIDFVKAHAAEYRNVVFACDPLERAPERASRTLYGVSGIPQQFVISKDGKIASTVEGYMQGEVLLDAALAAAGVKVDPKLIEQAAQDRVKREELGRRRPVPATPLKKGG